ncbi:hypothetical protein D9M70_589530 [compost metagenome]
MPSGSVSVGLLTGVVDSLIALGNLLMLLRFRAKTATAGKATIWKAPQSVVLRITIVGARLTTAQGHPFRAAAVRMQGSDGPRCDQPQDGLPQQ